MQVLIEKTNKIINFHLSQAIEKRASKPVQDYTPARSLDTPTSPMHSPAKSGDSPT